MRKSVCVIAALGFSLAAAGGAIAGMYDDPKSTAPGGTGTTNSPGTTGSGDSTMPPGGTGTGAPAGSMGETPTRMMDPQTINARTFKDADANNDGFIDSSEMASVEGLSENFSTADTDHDGRLSQIEFLAVKRPQ